MKARVKATGEIVEVVSNGFYYESMKDERIFDKPELEILYKINNPDYWEKLLHQYAGMAMQGLCANSEWDDLTWGMVAEDAIRAATALVNKLKEGK